MEEILINEDSLQRLGFVWNDKHTYMHYGKFIARENNGKYKFQYGELLEVPNKVYISQLIYLVWVLTDEQLIYE